MITLAITFPDRDAARAMARRLLEEKAIA